MDEVTKRRLLLKELKDDPGRRGWATMPSEDIADHMTEQMDVIVATTVDDPTPKNISVAQSLGFPVGNGLVYRTLGLASPGEVGALDRLIARADREGKTGPEVTAAKTVVRENRDAVNSAQQILDKFFDDPMAVVLHRGETAPDGKVGVPTDKVSDG